MPRRLLLAHYFGGSAASWTPLIAELGSAFECVAPSLFGFGGTPLPNLEPDLDLYAGQLLARADDAPFVLVGHSMGAKIVLNLAASRPANLRGLILIAPSPPTPEPMQEGERRKTVAAHGDRAAARARIEQITDASLPAQIFERCVDDQVDVDQRAWLWWLEVGSRQDISARTSKLDLPTLLIAGDMDKVLGLATPFAVAHGLKGSEVQVIAGGGHLVCLEQPALVAAAMRTFLAALAWPAA